MKDLEAIVKGYQSNHEQQKRMALATVVRVHGSSYRSPGARMLIMEDGRWIGSISGGCLEGDALRKARNVMATGHAVLVTYDTREESNQNLGIGLGCNGVIDVLLEPVTEEQNEHHVIQLFERLLPFTEPVAMATVCSGISIANKLVMNSNGDILHTSGTFISGENVTQHLKNIFHTGKSFIQNTLINGLETEVFLELLEPNVHLMIFGAGFDARPVSALAKTLGWNVSVTDECVAHIAPIFFPQADQLALCKRDFVDRDFQITNYTACVLMSHNYEYDRDVLKKLLSSPAPYIGMLGPRKRFDKMLLEFESQGLKLSTADFERIHSPIGLDIGAETPDEIAVSIISEIHARFRNRKGGFLKDRNAPIHQRATSSDQVFKEVFLRRH